MFLLIPFFTGISKNANKYKLQQGLKFKLLNCKDAKSFQGLK
jgi:hypothetical protein